MSNRHPWRRRVTAATLVIALVSVPFVAAALLTPVYHGPESDHFDGTRFTNIPAAATIEKSALDILRWAMTRDPGPWSERSDTVYHVPPRRSTELRITLVNHATVLIQTDDVNILTDPVWSDRASPVQFAGPRRFRDTGIRFADLPAIDVVLISHNHYDHLDRETVERLVQAHDPEFIVPLGNGHYLEKAGANRIVELDWWQRHTAGGLDIDAVPAQHWSRRSLFDTNRALWGGFVIGSAAGPVYFAGDTGMGPHFNEITARYGAPRLALLPIGTYLPRWFMAPQHIDPPQAVAAHLLLGAKQSMAIHFGTFRLGDDGQDQPIRDLRLAQRAAKLPNDTFWVPFNGDYQVFETDNESLARLAPR